MRKNLHLSDNSKRDDLENKSNKLYKTEPVLEHVPKNSLDIEPKQKHSINEQIIPAKISYGGIRPAEWGSINFVRSGKSGIIYDLSCIHILLAGKNELVIMLF